MSVAFKSVPQYTFIVIRYILAALILGIFFINKFKNFNIKMLLSGILVGTAMGLGCILRVVGLLYTTPSKSGFITGLNVVLVPVFIALLYKKNPDFKTDLGAVLSVSGLALMPVIGGNMGINKGDFLTLLSAAVFVEGFKVNLSLFSIGAILFTALFCTIFAYRFQKVA